MRAGPARLLIQRKPADPGSAHAIGSVAACSLRTDARPDAQAMTHPTLAIIRHEHGALSAMLRSISLLLSEHRRRGSVPDFGVLRAMLFYVDEFPEKLHHAKESQLLFPKLRLRSVEATEVLDRLDRDHAGGEHAIRELEHELLGFEMMGETSQGQARRERFEQAMTKYVSFYLEHMRIEETQVLPLAERVLTPEDWLELDAAFLKNRDALAGYEADEVYRPLFKRILMALPAPLGLGSVLEALAGTGIAHWPGRARGEAQSAGALSPHPNPLPVIGARGPGSLSRISGRGWG